MRLSIIISGQILVTALAVLGLTACEGEQPSKVENSSAQSSPVKVITTIYPLTYFTERIGGDQVRVIQMIEPGVESHDFEPTPSDVRLIGDADVFVYNHEAFESWALNLAKSANNSGLQVVQAAEIQMILEEGQIEHDGHELEEDHANEEHESGHDQHIDDEHEEDVDEGHDHKDGLDPHVWLNLEEALGMVNRILEGLTSASPESADSFTRNAELLIGELQQLDSELSAQLDHCERSTIVVSHLAFGHMAERYGFEQLGLAGLSPEFESGPAQIASVIDRINELGIKHIMQEPIVSDRLAETVSLETGADLVQLHPIEVRTPQEVEENLDFIDIMRRNGEALRTALLCD
jgi:zinc transport system substrate-binding protein